MQRIVFSMLATLGTFLALAFGAAPAKAQICGDLSDECEIADEVVDWNYDEFGGFFFLDSDTCEKMAESVFTQCEKAVKSAAKCWKDQINSIPKTAKSACKTEGDSASECNASYKDDAKDEIADVPYYEEFEIGCCEDRAESFYLLCFYGF
jgi:hypothetical protein